MEIGLEARSTEFHGLRPLSMEEVIPWSLCFHFHGSRQNMMNSANFQSSRNGLGKSGVPPTSIGVLQPSMETRAFCSARRVSLVNGWNDEGISYFAFHRRGAAVS